MPKGSIGTQTNIILKTPKMKKVKCNCKLCLNFRKNVCYLGKNLYPNACKWYSQNDYLLSKSEAKAVRKQNKYIKVKR
ncbi:hypothetical protein ABHA59_08775 [Clostridium tertium]|uniref:hypothetical protein n=1 Tax=Clostridium tertium TaxID=1559 RepID=UPI00325A625D